MADTQTLRQAALQRTPFSTWLGVVLLFFVFGIIAWALIGPSRRTTDYEQKRATDRMAKLKALREQDNQALTGYAWVDKTKGTVRIPIERAMELAMADLARKKPAPAGPIATPPPQAPAPAGSPAPSLTPKGMSVEGTSKAQPAAGTNPPGAAPGTQPGPTASPAASSAPVANPPVSPAPVATAAPAAPLPTRGVSPSPGGQ